MTVWKPVTFAFSHRPSRMEIATGHFETQTLVYQ
jgi:hypothetical protein